MPTKEGEGVGGHVDRQLGGRSLNHIMTGLLGEDEILLACTDKGDVFAWYTKVFADKINDRAPNETNPGGSSKLFKPFLKANVGKSAWGLAIHTKSRLMAVSSNRWEITVFAPALSENPHLPNKERWEKMPENERLVRCRRRNTRIIVGMTRDSNNMPNICFLDDKHGFAEKVAGTDIEGHTWIADIWKAEAPVRRVLRNCSYRFTSEEFQGDTSKGWGLMAFQDRHFMEVPNLQELLGFPHTLDEQMDRSLQDPGNDIDDRYISSIRNRQSPGRARPSYDLKSLLTDLPDNPCPPDSPLRLDGFGHVETQFYLPTNTRECDFYLMPDFPNLEDMRQQEHAKSPGGISGASTDETTLDSLDSQLHVVLGQAHQLINGLTGLDDVLTDLEYLMENPAAFTSWADIGARREKSQRKSELYGDRDMLYFTHSGEIKTHTEELVTGMLRRSKMAHNSGKDWAEDGTASDYILLRTYEKEVEFTQPTSKHARRWEMNPYWSSVFHCKNHDLTETTDLFFGTSRINFLFHIPELCVVVLGSPTGRVAVATLTKLKKPRPDHSGTSLWNRGMRIEHVLPRDSEEKKHRPLGRARPLHGLAVGRVPETSDDAALPQRWRIMLHYQNHLMLTYEITRKEQTDKLFFS